MDPSDRSVTQRADKRDETLTTKKFKLPEWLKRELTTYANQHYQGNASQLLREAIDDHIDTLEGDNEYTIKKIEIKISDLTEQVRELTEKIESEQNATTLQRQQLQQVQQSDTETRESDNGSLQTKVYEIVSTAEPPLKLKEIQEQTEAEILQVQQSVTELVDRGLLTESKSDNQPTYEVNTSN